MPKHPLPKTNEYERWEDAVGNGITKPINPDLKAWLEANKDRIGAAPRPTDFSAYWDESQHPRYPAGHPKGGQFVPKGEGEAGDTPYRLPSRWSAMSPEEQKAWKDEENRKRRERVAAKKGTKPAAPATAPAAAAASPAAPSSGALATTPLDPGPYAHFKTATVPAEVIANARDIKDLGVRSLTIKAWLDANEQNIPMVGIQTESMLSLEGMRTVNFDGTFVAYHKKYQAQASEYMAAMLSLHEGVRIGFNSVVISNSGNKFDAQRSQQLGKKFTSAGSIGSQRVMTVYKPERGRLSWAREILSHEGAHGLATLLYGHAHPIKAVLEKESAKFWVNAHHQAAVNKTTGYVFSRYSATNTAEYYAEVVGAVSNDGRAHGYNVEMLRPEIRRMAQIDLEKGAERFRKIRAMRNKRSS